MQYGMLEPKEIDVLIEEVWGERVEVCSYSLEIMAPTGFELMPDMYFFLGTILRQYGDARAAEERERAASIASLVFVNDPYALHPDVPFDRLNESAKTAAHSIAQTIAGLIMDVSD